MWCLFISTKTYNITTREESPYVFRKKKKTKEKEKERKKFTKPSQ
jgi:hypothetical protein